MTATCPVVDATCLLDVTCHHLNSASMTFYSENISIGEEFIEGVEVDLDPHEKHLT